MSVMESLRTEAFALSQTRRDVDAETNWLDARRGMINRMAFERSQHRQPERGSADDDWIAAEETVEWSEWAETQLRPYMALECVRAQDDVVARLTELTDIRLNQSVGVLAVLDGGPEFSRAQYKKHRFNCVDPRRIVDERDQAFQEFCGYTAQIFGGVSEPRKREFQDAYATSFIEGCCALAFALRLRRSLAQFNCSQNRSWPDELHARIAIGATWETIAESVEHTYCDEISIDHEVAKAQTTCVMTLLLADDVRVGLGRVTGETSRQGRSSTDERRQFLEGH